MSVSKSLRLSFLRIKENKKKDKKPTQPKKKKKTKHNTEKITNFLGAAYVTLLCIITSTCGCTWFSACRVPGFSSNIPNGRKKKPSHEQYKNILICLSTFPLVQKAKEFLIIQDSALLALSFPRERFRIKMLCTYKTSINLYFSQQAISPTYWLFSKMTAHY